MCIIIWKVIFMEAIAGIYTAVKFSDSAEQGQCGNETVAPSSALTTGFKKFWGAIP